MIKLNRKGFTLVELLAVIVVLAIIMIIAIPNVLGTLSDAQRGTFKVYAEKVLNTAQQQYQSDQLLGTLPTRITAYGTNGGYCYQLTGPGNGNGSLEMTAENYRGYVIVTVDSHLVPEFFVTLSDKNFSVKNNNYAMLSNTSAYLAPLAEGAIACPASFAVPQ